MSDISIEMQNITKTFPGVRALSNVNIKIQKGELHAIVGENGAGKSTLMKILGGVYTADSGKILINGNPVKIQNTRDSMKYGISVIYQEFNLMQDLTVAENVFIHNIPLYRKSGIINYRKLNDDTHKLLEGLDLDLNPISLVSELKVSEKQMVEIAKALSVEADVIVMDEPTASLNSKEVDALYKLIDNLKSQGKTIVFISHRMKEIFDLSDSVTVLRDGNFIGTALLKDLTEDEIIKMMVGRSIDQFATKAELIENQTVLEVQNLSSSGSFENVSFHLKKGEILGFAGLMGSGREEICKSIYGLLPITEGQIFIEGSPVKIKKPRDAMAKGIEFVTDDRKEAGIFSHMSVKENTTINILKKMSRFLNLFIPKTEELETLNKFTKYLNLKYSKESQKILNLSGGNQQKVILARALAGDCRILILLEPTRGIDVGAKSEIYTLLEKLAASGMAIILISSELPELISLSHRIIPIWSGKMKANLEGEDMQEELIMQHITGLTDQGVLK